jgi:predicted nuclease with TOPRIM domain
MAFKNTVTPSVSPETIRKAKIAKWLVIAAGVAVAAPAALLLLKGLLALIVAGVVGLSAIYLGPVVEMKLRNAKVKLIVAEAQSNPIETLLNQLADKRRAAADFADRITEFRTEVKNFQDKVATFEKQYPDDAPRFRSQLQTMQQLLHFREDRYKQVNAELENFAHAIDRAKAMWDMSQAAQRMNKVAGQQSGDTFEQIKTDASIDSVMKSVNMAFSQMETALLDNPEVKQAQQAAIATDPRTALPSSQREQQ